MKQRKPKAVRPLRKRVLLYCEGQTTEYLYFHGLKQEPFLRDTFDLKVEPGSGGSANQVVFDAIKRKNREAKAGTEYDQVWCVLDVEDVSRLPELRQALKLAADNAIEVFVSNPCFEVWLLAHFEQRSTAFPSAQAACEYLSRKWWESELGRAYDKADRDLYTRLADKVSTATVNAEHVHTHRFADTDRCECNASTEVYRLVKTLLAP